MPDLKPALWLELDESAAGLPGPPEMWWTLCSSRIHYEQPAHAGKSPIFPLVAIPSDQVLVPRAVLQQLYDAIIAADEEGLAGHAEPMMFAAALLHP